jgi:hypothetical protein
MTPDAAVPGVRIGGIVIDCLDPVKLAFFWKAITGFEQTWEEPFVPDPEGDNWMGLRDPSGRQPNLSFQKVPEDKVVKNRVHMDLYVDSEELAAEQIVALGASRLWRSPNPDDPFIVLADPEGNEFCVVRAPKEPSES